MFCYNRLYQLTGRRKNPERVRKKIVMQKSIPTLRKYWKYWKWRSEAQLRSIVYIDAGGLVALSTPCIVHRGKKSNRCARMEKRSSYSLLKIGLSALSYITSYNVSHIPPLPAFFMLFSSPLSILVQRPNKSFLQRSPLFQAATTWNRFVAATASRDLPSARDIANFFEH